jgi:hypothetical protein
MKTWLACVGFALVMLSAAFGASPVATASSSGGFELRGVPVRTEGVPLWPVMAGDSIHAGATPVLIRFEDGSRVTLGQNSSATVENTGQGLVFRVLSGAVQVAPVSGSKVRFFNNSTPLQPTGAVASAGASQRPLARTPPPPPVSQH